MGGGTSDALAEEQKSSLHSELHHVEVFCLFRALCTHSTFSWRLRCVCVAPFMASHSMLPYISIYTQHVLFPEQEALQVCKKKTFKVTRNYLSLKVLRLPFAKQMSGLRFGFCWRGTASHLQLPGWEGGRGDGADLRQDRKSWDCVGGRLPLTVPKPRSNQLVCGRERAPGVNHTFSIDRREGKDIQRLCDMLKQLLIRQ